MEPSTMRSSDIVIIRGGGDLATGIIQKFWRSGFKLLVLEKENPTAIRRSVSLCEAVYSGHMQVEDISCTRIDSLFEMESCHERGTVPILVDAGAGSIAQLKPAAVIDAIMAKRNLGTNRDMAAVSIALGPGFEAGVDVDAVIETERGHELGRLILKGSARPNTGLPGEVGGKSAQRVIHAPLSGELRNIRQIGDVVEAGEAICEVAGETLKAPFKGLIRGLLREGLPVSRGLKIADIDPRLDINWRTISDKARCIGGATLEAFLYLKNTQGER
jgi:xanthine dehydrogenase accessory factor